MSTKKIEVPYIDQTASWPTGCESVSSVMLLQFLGLDIGVDEFVSFLPKYPIRKENNEWISGDPSQYFIGTPEDPDSFGCYAPVISSVLNEIFRQRNLPWKAKNVSALSTDTLLSTYIDHNIPVIYWATIDLLEHREGPVWKLYSEDGASFQWRSNEHCMLLTGYDGSDLQFNDPWHDHGVIMYDRELTEQRHREMYSMAVSVEPF